jgi:catechol 2,3-dioxygenase-like lactoylglutathione lyase family enzyme
MGWRIHENIEGHDISDLMATIKSNRIVIELHVPDFKKVKTFYKKLGFEIVGDEPIGKELGYIVLKLGKTYLNFYGGDNRIYKHSFFNEFPKDTRRGYEIEITVILDNIEKYYKKVYPKIKSAIVQPLIIKRWGKKDFRISDPFGFYIRFTEPVDWVKSK